MEYLTTKEAAKILGISLRGMQKVIERNIEKHPGLAKKFGRDWMIDMAELDKLYSKKNS